MSGCEILFEGSKLFPKIKKALNVLIIEHTVFDVIEIILTNEPTPEQAEARIYIDEEVLALKVGLLTAEGERKNFDASCYHKVAQKKVKYIVDRLSATGYSEEKKLIEFCMQFTFADRDEEFDSGVEADSMVIERPDALFPYKRQNMQYILSDKCSTEASFSSVSHHRDSLAMVPRHYQKPNYPRSMIPASTFSATGNDGIIQRAHSDVGQRNDRSISPIRNKRPFSGGTPVKDSVRRLLGLSKVASDPVDTNLDASPCVSPNKSNSLSPKAGYTNAGSFGVEGTESPIKDMSSGGSSKKEAGVTLLSLPSKLWSSVSALGSSLKITRSLKVVPNNESCRSTCPEDQTGSTSSKSDEKLSIKSETSSLASSNVTPLPSQRTNVHNTLPTVVEPQ